MASNALARIRVRLKDLEDVDAPPPNSQAQHSRAPPCWVPRRRIHPTGRQSSVPVAPPVVRNTQQYRQGSPVLLWKRETKPPASHRACSGDNQAWQKQMLTLELSKTPGKNQPLTSGSPQSRGKYTHTTLSSALMG